MLDILMSQKKWPFEVRPGHTKKDQKIKTVSGDPRLYFLQGVNSACVIGLLSYSFYFIGDKIYADHFKYEIDDRLRFTLYVAISHVIDKERPRCKLLYRVFK